jgi:branched-chain amino acid aminotransferase
MTATVNVNGVISDDQHAVISVFDHGFLYGEGIYETLRTYGGRPFLLQRHMRRLRQSARLIALDVPFTNDELTLRIAATTSAAGASAAVRPDWYVRVILTRGVGDLTYDPAATPAPSLIIIVKPHVEPAHELYASGVRVILSSVMRNHPDSVSPMIKSNNLLNCALAMQEGIRHGAYEVLMRNYRGELAEGALSNIFIVKDGTALTPPVSVGLLPGVTREFVFEVGMAAGIPVREQILRDDDIHAADEMFLTGTTREIMAISRVGDRAVGSGVPGPLTRALHAKFREMALRQVEQPPEPQPQG